MPQQQPAPGATGSTNPHKSSDVDRDIHPEVAPVGTAAEAALDVEDELQGDLDYDALKGQPQEDVQGRKTQQKNRDILRGGA